MTDGGALGAPVELVRTIGARRTLADLEGVVGKWAAQLSHLAAP